MKRGEILELRKEVQHFVRLFGLLEQNVTPCGFSLSLSQVFALQELEREILSVSELAERLRLERSSVSRLVDVMVKEGFIFRELNENNRREVRLSLTEKGKRSIQQVSNRSVEFYQNILSELPNGDQNQILWAFKTLNERLVKVRGEF